MNDPDRTLTPSPDQLKPVAESALLDQPQQIGRYRVQKILGKGGFGLVYLAYDDQLKRAVAIKVAHARLIAETSDAEAYLTEARTVANLDHPHIVPVFDVGSTEQFPCYVVSKYIDGTDLFTRLKQSRLPLNEAVELVATVAEALHYAHKQEIVHRDIKPGNILLDKSGKPFVADFGLALRERDIGHGPIYAGTPAYMSPEQARGEGHRVDGRSDVFSLGVVFYELLTGRRPFKGESTAELLDQVTTFEPRPPRQLDDTIPKELERICLKSLAKRASERYSTAKDLTDDLRHWLGNPSTTTGAESKLVELEPATPSVGKDVFLSYATPDKEAAFRLCRLLEGKGISCWIAPRDVTPGADYAEAIVRAIEGTGTTILFLSAHANASIHVTHEVERATSKRKRVIPICLEDVKPGPSLELHLATAHRLDALRLSPEQVAAQLVIVLRGENHTPAPAITPPVSDQAIKIVPKGLRSFDAGDADFFLELLPGPRDRERLPDGIRFWKTRIEEMDADNTFSVGLIYGPSGCGKSSLMKAGLLPRLAGNVIAVYVEATAEETEARLLKGLRRQVPQLPTNLGLIESLAALRQGRLLNAGQKVLLVLDQFEQWLHAKHHNEETELVQALRQCDGERVQSIVMVRDDFWLAVSRFMQALEIVMDGENSRLVDLFDLLHARKVLAAFGRAYGRLPDNLGQCSRDQESFLDQAASGLAQENKVVSVWLALFAEMVKGRPWTPATLKEVGGTEGVGVTFLEDTLSSRTANPKHRLHQKAAQRVLRSLLSEAGTDIKGHMRSQHELLEASGYANRPKDFEELLRILDTELRLITPTDPEGKEDADTFKMQAGAKYYQLTHDYLVPSLRDWLTCKQKETRRGRAELLLADRAAVWNARQENRQLPSLWQWASIRWWTQKKNWTPPQRKMMRKSGRYHAERVAMVALLLVAGALIGLWLIERQNKATHAAVLVNGLLEAPIEKVQDIIKEIEDYRTWANPLLEKANETIDLDPQRKLRVSLALLPVDPGQVNYLFGRLLDAEPNEARVLLDELIPHQLELPDQIPMLNGEINKKLPPALPSSDESREMLAKRQANAAVALLRMKQGEKVWPLLKHSPDPRLRSYLIHRFGPLGADARTIVNRLDEELDVTILRALILSLGEFEEKAWSADDRNRVTKKLQEIYRTADDPGLHAASEWLLRNWGHHDWLKKTNGDWAQEKDQRENKIEAIKQMVAKEKEKTPPQWYVNGQGQTMVVIPGPVEFVMGSPPTEARFDDEVLHKKRIGRTFAIAVKSVTVEQYRRFNERYMFTERYAPTPECPVVNTSWYQAAAYCNWLSEKEGIDPKQWCYEIKGEVTKLTKNYTSLTGYRLPTEAEMEYATRAGALTTRYYGETEELLPKYAWYQKKSQERTWPVGSLKPNDLGLFDVQGNVYTWCQESYKEYPKGSETKVSDDQEDDLMVASTVSRVLRGGTFIHNASLLRSAHRFNYAPTDRSVSYGFRVARTLPIGSFTALQPSPEGGGK